MPDTPDKGTEQADDEGATTASATQGNSGGAPDPVDVDALKKQLEAQMAEAERLRQRHLNAERKIREQGQELGRFRQLYQESGSNTGYPEYGAADTSNQSAGDTAAQRALARASWSMLAEEIDGTPKEKRELRERIEEFLENDPNANQFVRSDPYHTYRAVVDHWQRDKELKELEELRQWKSKASGQRDVMAASAIVSGSGASEPMETISEKDLANMSSADLEKKFGKERVMSGLLRKP